MKTVLLNIMLIPDILMGCCWGKVRRKVEELEMELANERMMNEGMQREVEELHTREGGERRKVEHLESELGRERRKVDQLKIDLESTSQKVVNLLEVNGEMQYWEAQWRNKYYKGKEETRILYQQLSQKLSSPASRGHF